FVSYTIQPGAATVSGTRVPAAARIVFDNNDPVDTPPTFNTVDALPPTSHVLPLATLSDSAGFVVRWTGKDAGDGSGLQSFDVYVKREGGPYELWRSATTDTSATFLGSMHEIYSFYSIARDSTGLVEAPPGAADAVTTIARIAGVDSRTPVLAL